MPAAKTCRCPRQDCAAAEDLVSTGLKGSTFRCAVTNPLILAQRGGHPGRRAVGSRISSSLLVVRVRHRMLWRLRLRNCRPTLAEAGDIRAAASVTAPLRIQA